MAVSAVLHADFEAKCAEVEATLDKAEAALKTAEKKLADMGVLIKHITTYQQTKPAADGMKEAKDKDAYRRTHESELILHEAAVRAIRTVYPDGGKLPSLAMHKAEYESLTGRKITLRTEYDKLKKQVQEYDIIKRNVGSILNQGSSKSKTKNRETSL